MTRKQNISQDWWIIAYKDWRNLSANIENKEVFQFNTSFFLIFSDAEQKLKFGNEKDCENKFCCQFKRERKKER